MDLDFSKIKIEMDGCVGLTVELPPELEDKYSRTFAEIMVKQLTAEIERALSVRGLEKSNIELKLVFMPDTFMEHSSENVTYRRLLITDKGCSDKDLWVKWTRLNSAVAYSAFDTPSEDDILFELGEDVPQKIREREYRFLVRTDTDRYHSAMGRKNITEWRDLIKRAHRRGDIEKVVNEVELADHSDKVHDKLSSLLSGLGIPVPKESSAPAPEAEVSAFDIELQRAREVIFGDAAPTAEESAPAVDNEISVPETVVFDFSKAEDTPAFAPVPIDDEIEDSPEEEDTDLDTVDELYALDGEEDDAAPDADYTDEVSAREALEAKLRLVDEMEAKVAAEAVADSLRKELEAARAEIDSLKRENDMLRIEYGRIKAQMVKLAEEKDRAESLRAIEAERLKDEIDARVRAENREKERLAEAARIAVENQKRIEAERAAEAERLRAEEERRIAEEEKRREAERLAAEREREAERIRRETEIARGNVAPESAPVAVKDTAPTAYNYISRRVRLYFKHLIDPNITKRIYDIIKTTIEFYHKEDVYIRIKATTPEEDIVLLDFLEIPEEEAELLVNIIKVLGNSNIGITKATVE
ncbi:MAG: hypothetical protein IKV20_03725 [Clostridia bacterium]|nr:hypothetical protein [Clostridia bacterium]